MKQAETIVTRFEHIARESPERTALQYEQRAITYRMLNRKADEVANTLIRRNGKPSGQVLVFCEDPLQNVALQLGVLKAGKTAVPVDVTFPMTRVKSIFDDSCSEVIATEKKNAERAGQLTDSVIIVDELAPESAQCGQVRSIPPKSLAYILYTSGSTGTPKGVIQTHHNLLHVAKVYNHALRLGPTDRVTTPTSLAYTGTLWALLATLCNGATFVFTTFDSPFHFMDSLTTGKITVAQMIVTLLRQFMTAVDQPLHLPDLRLVYTGGEALHREDVKTFAKLFPSNCELLYNFGSTEAGILTHLKVDLEGVRSGCFQQNADDPVFPAGYVIDDNELLLMDEHGSPVRTGADGEIAVMSDYLSPGYWKDPSLTEKHFSLMPHDERRLYLTGDIGRFRADQCLLHLGRRDHQIKIRGYRVQLEEVEGALRSIPGIEQAAVLAVNDPGGNRRIAAYVQRNLHCDLSAITLRQKLGEILPSYMVPTLFVFVDHMPVSPGGKLIRDNLPYPDFTRPELNAAFLEPRTPTEEFLCAITRDVLQIHSVGVRDNLFDLGADSFAVFRLIGRIKESMNTEVQPRTIFQIPVIEDLARNLDEQNARAR